MSEHEIAALEAVLFVSGDPVSMEKLAAVFEITHLQLSNWLDTLERELEGREVIKTD